MAASLRPGGGRRGRRGRRHMAEINVTPFVDVMLVLLIVFMVAAPLMSTGVEVDLPDADARALASENSETVALQIDADGVIRIGEEVVALDDLVDVVSERLGENATDRRIYVLGDQRSSYGAVMPVVAVLQRAGFTRLTFPTDTIRPEAAE